MNFKMLYAAFNFTSVLRDRGTCVWAKLWWCLRQYCVSNFLRMFDKRWPTHASNTTRHQYRKFNI